MPQRTLSEREFNAIRDKLLTDAPDGMDEASFHRWIGPRMAAEVGRAESLPAAPEGSALGRFASNAGAMLNPVTAVKGLYDAVRHPIVTGSNIYGASKAQADQAVDMAREGRYVEAAGHALGTLPLIGPAAVAAGQQIAEGDIAGGLGTGAGMIAGMGAPAALRKVAGTRAPALMANRDAAVTRAVETGQRMGVPIDAATATGNPFVRFAQKTADESLIGSFIGGRKRAAQQAGLTKMGETLASKAHPRAVAAGEAGEAAQQGGRAAVKHQRVLANDAYDRLRAIEADPANAATFTGPGGAPSQTVNMAVDLTPVKDAMRPIHAKLAAEAKLVPLMGSKATAYTRLDALINGPDVAPLSVADAALSQLKGMARSRNPDLRNAGQGIAAKAVNELHEMVSQAAQRAGPDAVAALHEGRQATIAKYTAADILKQLEGRQGTKGPVTSFRGMTQSGDTSIAHLRDVVKQTPGAKPLIGRAVLDELIDSPTMGPDASFKAWQRLGPETKHLLYDPSHVQALDDFFLLRKKIAENPNPSGSGLTILKGGELYLQNPGLTIGLPALSALLHSKAGVALLTQGFRLPAASKAAMGVYAGRLLKASEQAGVPLAAPAFAGDSRQ